MGYDIIEAESGNAGVEKAFLEMPDLIIMDLMMHGIDGIEATRRLKSNPSTQEIPIIVSTAWIAESSMKEVLAAGAAVVLTKPLTHDLLREVCKSFSSSSTSIEEFHDRTSTQGLDWISPKRNHRTKLDLRCV